MTPIDISSLQPINLNYVANRSISNLLLSSLVDFVSTENNLYFLTSSRNMDYINDTPLSGKIVSLDDNNHLSRPCSGSTQSHQMLGVVDIESGRTQSIVLKNYQNVIGQDTQFANREYQCIKAIDPYPVLGFVSNYSEPFILKDGVNIIPILQNIPSLSALHPLYNDYNENYIFKYEDHNYFFKNKELFEYTIDSNLKLITTKVDASLASGKTIIIDNVFKSNQQNFYTENSFMETPLSSITSSFTSEMTFSEISGSSMNLFGNKFVHGFSLMLNSGVSPHKQVFVTKNGSIHIFNKDYKLLQSASISTILGFDVEINTFSYDPRGYLIVSDIKSDFLYVFNENFLLIKSIPFNADRLFSYNNQLYAKRGDVTHKYSYSFEQIDTLSTGFGSFYVKPNETVTPYTYSDDITSYRGYQIFSTSSNIVINGFKARIKAAARDRDGFFYVLHGTMVSKYDKNNKLVITKNHPVFLDWPDTTANIVPFINTAGVEEIRIFINNRVLILDKELQFSNFIDLKSITGTSSDFIFQQTTQPTEEYLRLYNNSNKQNSFITLIYDNKSPCSIFRILKTFHYPVSTLKEKNHITLSYDKTFNILNLCINGVEVYYNSADLFLEKQQSLFSKIVVLKNPGLADSIEAETFIENPPFFVSDFSYKVYSKFVPSDVLNQKYQYESNNNPIRYFTLPSVPTYFTETIKSIIQHRKPLKKGSPVWKLDGAGKEAVLQKMVEIFYDIDDSLDISSSIAL